MLDAKLRSPEGMGTKKHLAEGHPHRPIPISWGFASFRMAFATPPKVCKGTAGLRKGAITPALVQKFFFPQGYCAILALSH
jgi:hypothetical protein